MKIATIVGARPQFIKAAAVSRVMRMKHQEFLIHTGQHYDSNMSDVFFRELQIPKPDINLCIGSATHAQQTAAMMVKIEEILLKECPDYILVYGDTNSTLAGALAAVKIHIPIIHVEAGLRSFNMCMPEEVNRILTDRISSILFCPTETAVQNLKNEGINQNIYNIGDVMCDAVLYYSDAIRHLSQQSLFSHIKLLAGIFPQKSHWYLATIHRAENTDTPEKVQEILSALNVLDAPVIFPAHPRIRGMVLKLCEELTYTNITVTEPVGYLDMLYLTQNAIKVITDSGGLQKEAYILNTPCVTIREQTEWIETLKGNHNILAHPTKKDIVSKVLLTHIDDTARKPYYGTGNAANQLCQIIQSS